jgi:hypothetical protein
MHDDTDTVAAKAVIYETKVISVLEATTRRGCPKDIAKQRPKRGFYVLSYKTLVLHTFSPANIDFFLAHGYCFFCH